MHTIRNTKDGWLVQFVEFSFEPGYRAERETVAIATTANIAGLYASWLNGGDYPGDWGDQIRFNEARFINA